LLTASKDLSSDEERSLAIFTLSQQKEILEGCLRLLRRTLVMRLKTSFENSNRGPAQAFVRCLQKGDAVITFNWDILLEQELFHAGKRGDIIVLKLHGSLDWPKGRVRKAQSNYFDVDDDLSCLKPQYLDAYNILLEMPLPCIVPPVYQKKPAVDWRGKSCWDLAYDRLGRAAEEPESHIVIIGYSLPPEDLHARMLLRMGIGACGDNRKTLHVIDPNPEVGAQYFVSITPKVKFHQRRFTGDELADILSYPSNPVQVDVTL